MQLGTICMLVRERVLIYCILQVLWTPNDYGNLESKLLGNRFFELAL